MSEQLTKLRRRRGVSKVSITCIDSRIKELEGLRDQPSTVDNAYQN